MMVGSILVSSAFQTHRYFMRSISRENEKAQLQRDIAAIANFLEKDIRMSGLGCLEMGSNWYCPPVQVMRFRFF
jgi:type II secretory pathway component PulJ